MKDKYFEIKTEADIQSFMEETSGLHDGHIISIAYTNDGVKFDGNRTVFDFTQTKLVLKIIRNDGLDGDVTEVVFENIYDWHMVSGGGELFGCNIKLDGSMICFTDSPGFEKQQLERSTYVMAFKMCWRKL